MVRIKKSILACGMTTKQIVLLLSCITFPLVSVIAQKSYWVAGVGYGLPSSQRTLFVQQDLRYGGYAVANSSNKSIHGSYGAGLSFNTGFHRITKNDWGWGIEFNYLFGKKIKSDVEATAPGGSMYNLDIVSKSNTLFVTPMVFKIFPNDGRIQPFVSAGLILGAPKVVTEYSLFINNVNDQGQTVAVIDELTHKFTVGAKLACGINIKSEKKSIFFVNIEFNILRPWQKKMTLLKYRENGVDVLKGMSEEEKTIVFEKEFDITNGPGNKEVADTDPFGSICIRVGYRFLLR
jgi:hypothetical protein